MSSNFSNSVNNFLSNNSNYTAETVKNELSDIAGELYNRGKAITSIFMVDENTNMDKDGFTSLFASACDNSLDDVKSNQVDLLYKILDTDGDNYLSRDELAVFADTDGEITDFKMWQVVKDYSSSETNANAGTSAANENNDTAGANDAASGTTENNETEGAKNEPEGAGGNEGEKEIDIPVNSFSAANNPEGVSEELKTTARDLWLAMDNNNNDKIDNDGTDEKKIDDILNASDLTDEEFVDMALYFEHTYGLFAEKENTMSGKKSLITLLAKELSGDDEKNAEEKFAKRLVSAANAGDQDAAFLLSIEVYGATRGQLGTEETFLDAVFNNVNASVIKDMNKYYDDMADNNLFENTKGTMSKDIDADYSKEPSWFKKTTRSYSQDAPVSPQAVADEPANVSETENENEVGDTQEAEEAEEEKDTEPAKNKFIGEELDTYLANKFLEEYNEKYKNSDLNINLFIEPVLKSKDLSIEEKTKLLAIVMKDDSEGVKTSNSLSTIIRNNPDGNFFYNSVKEMTDAIICNTGEYTVDDIVNFTNRLDELGINTTGVLEEWPNKDINYRNNCQDVIENITELFACLKGNAEDISKLASLPAFDIKNLAEFIQQHYSYSNETKLLKNLLDSVNIYSESPEYNISDDRAKELTSYYSNSDLCGILNEVNSNRLPYNEAAYLLSSSDTSSIMDEFRDLSKSDQEKYLGTLFKIFSQKV